MLDTRLNRRTKEVQARCLIQGEEAKVFNASVGGALVEKVIGTLSVGDKMDVVFVFPKAEQLTVKAKVLRVQERSIALKFDDECRTLMDRLREMPR